MWEMHAKTHQTPQQVHTRKKHKHRPDALKRIIQYNNLQMPQKCLSNPKSTSETKKLTPNQTKSAWQMHAKKCQTLAGHLKKVKMLGKKAPKHMVDGHHEGPNPFRTVNTTLEMSKKHSQSMWQMHAKKTPNVLDTLKNA